MLLEIGVKHNDARLFIWRYIDEFGTKKRFMRELAIDFDANKDHFELDHIIPLAWDGHPRNPHNLRLQVWKGQKGAKCKDRLKPELQCFVCSGGVPLDVAQDAIWSAKQAAYAEYGRRFATASVDFNLAIMVITEAG